MMKKTIHPTQIHFAKRLITHISIAKLVQDFKDAQTSENIIKRSKKPKGLVLGDKTPGNKRKLERHKKEAFVKRETAKHNKIQEQKRQQTERRHERTHRRFFNNKE